MCDQKDGGGLRNNEETLSVSDESEPEDVHGDDNEEPCDQAALAQFSLKGGGSAFSYRTRNIFDCLDRVPTSSSSSSSTLNHQAPSRKTHQPPPSPIIAAKRKGTPDYLLHPERWTHYSLEGVSETSEQSNAMAAFNFLSELQERKEEQRRSEGKQQGEEEEQGKQSHSDSSPSELQHIFCRPNKPRREAAAAERHKEREMHLSHLQEEQEEQEEKPTESGTEKEIGKGVKEEEVEEATPVFRKIRSKNYRRSSEGEELWEDEGPGSG